MPIDPRISLGVQQLQLPDPVARYGQLATIQNAQNQNALAQYQLGTAKREEETTNALNEAYAKSYDPKTGKINRNTLRETLARGGFGSKLPGVEKTLLELDKEEMAQRETGFKVEKAKNEFIAQAKRDTSQNPSDANLTAFKEDLIANPLFNAAEKTQMAANVDRILAMPVDQRRSFMASQGASAGELKPTVQSVNRGGQTDVLSVPTFNGAPTTLAQLADVPLPKTVQDQKAQIALASRAPPQPQQPQPPVAVVDPLTGKQVYVSREEALSKKMTPASAMEGLAPKEIQTREAKFPAATSAIKTFETSADRLATDLEKLAKHPGLSGISGLIYGRTPAVTKDARAAQALYDSIVARGGFQELQNMRSASPTGGALGNVSNQEGQYLRDAFAPINRTQDTADLSRALTEAAGATRSSKQRLREAYDMTYDYKNQGKAPAGAVDASNPLLKGK
jgi:hypothetical protein